MSLFVAVTFVDVGVCANGRACTICEDEMAEQIPYVELPPIQQRRDTRHVCL